MSKTNNLKLMVHGSVETERKKTTISIPIALMQEINWHCVGNRTGILDVLIETGLNDYADIKVPKPNEVGARQALPAHLSLDLLKRAAQALPGVSIQHAMICLLQHGLETIKKSEAVTNVAN